MEGKQLIEAKIARLMEGKDEAAVAFVTAVVTGGGVCRKQYGYPRGFGEYRTTWGEVKFEETKKELIEEGILREDEELDLLNLEQTLALSQKPL